MVIQRLRRAVCALSTSALTFVAVAPIAAQDAREGWPREMQTQKGRLVVYQPQLDTFVGNELTARAAVSILPTGKSEPVFGAVWIEASVWTDRDTRTVTLQQVRVPQVRFPNATEEEQAQLSEFLEQEIPKWDVEMSLDRLLAALDLAERQTATAAGLKHDPPKILFREEPTVLVSTDGEPRVLDMPNSELKYVANTAFLIALEPKSGRYYLSAGADTWYASQAVAGPWSVASTVPGEIVALAQSAAQETPPETDDDSDADPGPVVPPAILVATEPTELIVSDGPLEFTPLPGNELLFVTNTESDILMELASQRHFILLSGRWFASQGLGGPWSYVASEDLPSSFAAIPEESDAGHLLTWVAGTQQAKEAVLDAAIPQTAAIARDATIDVEYDGDPKFEDVEKTTLQYAVNTSSQVLKLAGDYYCVREGVWYHAKAATGPWAVATEVPAEVQEIPPESPVFNVKYVHVYDVTPTVVYVGYTPGYSNSYVHGGCVVYGTGWYYPPYWGPHYYYPHHATWGFHVRWNPWYGWGVGFSYGTGRFTFSMGVGGWGGWYRGGYWGPGYHPYHRGYNRGWYHGARAGYRAGYRSAYRHQNIYRNRPSTLPSNRPSNRPGNSPGNRPTTRPTTPGVARPMPSNRPNDVAVDRAGQIQQRDSGGTWQPRSGTATRDTRSLDRTYQSRQRGSTRTQSYRGSAQRGGGGGRRR